MSAVGEGSGSGAYARPTLPPQTGIFAIAKVALGDMIDLGVLTLLLIGTVGMIGGLVAKGVGVRSETARLEALIAKAGNVEAQLAAIETKIGTNEADVARMQARVPDAPVTQAIDGRLDFRPGELGVAVHSTSTWTTIPVTLALGGAVDATRHDRSLEVTGRFRDILTFVTDLEGWPELVAVKALNIRAGRGPARPETITHIELSLFQVPKREAAK